MEKAHQYDTYLFNIKLFKYILTKNYAFYFTVPFNEKIDIVNGWMMLQRAKEEKIQSEDEMKQFLSCIQEQITKLGTQKEEWLAYAAEPDAGSTTIPYQRLRLKKIGQQKAIIASLEIEKLKLQQANAVTCFGREPQLVESYSLPFLEVATIFENDGSEEETDSEHDTDSEEETHSEDCDTE